MDRQVKCHTSEYCRFSPSIGSTCACRMLLLPLCQQHRRECRIPKWAYIVVYRNMRNDAALISPCRKGYQCEYTCQYDVSTDRRQLLLRLAIASTNWPSLVPKERKGMLVKSNCVCTVTMSEMCAWQSMPSAFSTWKWVRTICAASMRHAVPLLSLPLRRAP